MTKGVPAKNGFPAKGVPVTAIPGTVPSKASPVVKAAPPKKFASNGDPTPPEAPTLAIKAGPPNIDSKKLCERAC